MRYFIPVCFIACLLSICAPNTYACSCVTPEVAQAFRAARAVFVGEVTEIVEPRTDKPKAPLADRLYAIRFKVDRSWKGVKSQEIIVLSDQGRAGCFSWGPFLKGKKYLVYAERRTPSGSPIRNLSVLFSCNRTALLANATEDLKALETVGLGISPAALQFQPSGIPPRRPVEHQEFSNGLVTSTTACIYNGNGQR